MRPRSWKRVESKVATDLGGHRNPGSGSDPTISTGDVVHPTLYVEVRSRSQMAVFAWWADVAAHAAREGKTPVLVLHQTGKQSYLAIVELRELDRLRKASNHAKDN